MRQYIILLSVYNIFTIMLICFHASHPYYGLDAWKQISIIVNTRVVSQLACRNRNLPSLLVAVNGLIG